MDKNDHGDSSARSAAAVPGGAVSFCHDEFEFGFVLLAEEVAEKLRGEDDHTVITANADPTTFDATAASVHGANVALFCLSDAVALVPTDGGVRIAYGAACTDDELRTALAREVMDWVPVTTLDLPSGKLIGQSADRTLEDARASDSILEITLAPGGYDVLRGFEDEDSENVCSVLRLRRQAPSA